MIKFASFCDDFIDEIYKNYDAGDFAYNARERDFAKVLAGYLSIFTTKFVVDCPRDVLISRELETKMNLDSALKEKVEFMIEKITKGDNINGHLTRRIFNIKVNDDLYSDWGIKHIHLTKIEASSNQEMALNRSNDLLFAIFEPNVCYLLNVQEHNVANVFALMDHLKIMVNNWPGLYLVHDENISCDNPVKTNEEVVNFRNANINVICYEIDGAQYVKTRVDGLTGVGTDLSTQMLASRLIRAYQEIDDEYINIDFQFLCNDFGAIRCKNKTYDLGWLYPPTAK